MNNNMVHIETSIKGRLFEIRKENQRLIDLLIEKRVLRKSMVPGWMVIYTEDGPKDIRMIDLIPCVYLFDKDCNCKEHGKS